jgi:hypothetical protein
MSDIAIPDSLREVEAVLGRRMDQLARDNAQLRTRQRMMMWAIGGLLIITIVLTIVTAPRAATIVPSLQANEFVLRDASGLVRGIWDIEREGGPRMVLRDGDGRERLTLSLLRDGSPGVSLADREGRPRAVVAVSPDGTSNLVFVDAAGTTRAVLAHSSVDATTLVLADREGYTRAAIVVNPNGEGEITYYETTQSAPSLPDTVTAAQ